MEGVRFTGAEGGARLAGAARARNTLAALAREHAAFVAGKLLQEDAHRIRGALSQGRQRSVYVTRELRAACVAYELTILTDLAVTSATRYDAVEDWRDELERKEVLVATSAVVRRLLAERVLSMDLINVLVLDSCHAIHSDPHLQAIMAIHSEQATRDHPRILALTYPLFSQINKDIKSNDTSETISSPTNEAFVEPNELMSMEDDSDLKENDSCNIPDPKITEIEDKVDMLRIDNIIKSNDKTKLILIKDAIFANKAKIIELDASDDENCMTEAAIKTTDKVSDKGGNKMVDKDGVEMDGSVDKIDVELSKNYVELELTKSIDDIELELNKGTATESKSVGQIELNHDNKDLFKETSDISHTKNSAVETSNNTNLKINPIEIEFKDINDDIISIEIHNNAIEDKNEDEEIPQKEIKDTKSEMFLQDEVETKEIKELTEKLQNVVTNAEDEDFLLYEKLEWKIQELERKLCCTADLAEDIDGIKRLSATVSEPRELIVQYARRSPQSCLPETYLQLEGYMRETAADVLRFIDEHRYDPTEIYGEDAFCEELKGIPDPTLDPREVFHQFLYVLDELGPYGADKAALSLVAKLEKLKIKIPYERHFLLLCVCMTVFLKIRCVAEHAFQKYESDWEKIQKFSTPKMHRFIQILEQFKPPNDARSPRNSPAHRNSKSENVESNSDIKKTLNESVADNTNKAIDDTMANGLNIKFKHSDVTSVTKSLDTTKMLDDINQCDFVSLSNKLADRVNTYQSNLAEIHDMPPPDDSKTDLEAKSRGNENENDSMTTNEVKTSVDVKGPLMTGPSRRLGPRNRGRGRGPRHGHAARALQMQQNPDALCGIVFMKDPLMAKVLFLIIVDVSRSHGSLGFLCAQYSGEERPADPAREPRELERQRRVQEEVLKFRMHECNLLLATSALEEGIDLPRCNLVLRWDAPASYRSYSLCRSRARAPRSACVLLADGSHDACGALVRHVAVYRELDQMLSRKCGCGVQDEPPQSEEEHANLYTKLIKPYTPSIHSRAHRGEEISICNGDKAASDELKQDISEFDKVEGERTSGVENECHGEMSEIKGDKEVVSDNIVSDSELASVDLSSAISLINRYCGKLPSDTFTRLAPQWWIEEVLLPVPAADPPVGCTTGCVAGSRDRTNLSTGCATCGEERKMQKAYICTLRLPLNCPVKYNIVGHPMPTRVLARRIVALQACRILHRSAELDNQLMPIGKENFRAPELEYAPAPPGDAAAELRRPSSAELAELARPGTTKRRQYYFKRTAWSFTDCQPVQDASDSEVEQPADTAASTTTRASEDKQCDPESGGGKRNMLYAIVSRLCCALPERYNTRGRRLHVPQTARQGLGILTGRQIKKIPAFPVYTRSGEVRVSVERIADADVRVSPRRARLVRRFMKFVFAEVLRVRRRGMRLSTDGRYNNYYVVPTCRSIRDDGSDKIDVDWEFLELIYRHTERRGAELERPAWNPDDDESRTMGSGAEGNAGGKRLEDDAIGSGKKEEEDGKVVPEEGKATSEDGNEELQKGNTVLADGNKEKYRDGKKELQERRKDSQEGNVSPERAKNDSQEGYKDGQDGKKDLQDKNGPQEDKQEPQDGKKESENGKKDTEEGPLKKELHNPLLGAGEKFVFDAERYKEAVVTPWYRNQDQPQFFLVAEICWKLSPESAFPSATHTTFRHYYTRKYGVRLTQAEQPLLDVDHTSARLNLLTPRYVNRKGVALPVSSERTRRDKRDRLDQKQILVPELCRVHPFAAPLWFATVALPCVLYRINALLIADEIRRSVAIDVGLGSADINEHTRPGFEWPPLDFGWSLAEVLSVDEAKAELERREGGAERDREATQVEQQPGAVREKTLNEILQEKEDAESGFEIGMWSNDMASSVPDEYDEMMEPLPPNLTFCTSASGGSNWPDSIERPAYPPPRPSAARAFSMADSDCSYMSSDLDTDDSSLDTDGSDDDTSGFGSHQHTSARLGVRIEYKTPHEAEAFELKTEKKTASAPQPDEADDMRDRIEADAALRDGPAPDEHIQKFRHSVDKHRKEILEKGLLINESEPITTVLPPIGKDVTNQFNVYGIAAKAFTMTATDCLKDTHDIPEQLPHLNVKNSNNRDFRNTTDSTSENSGTSFNNKTDLTSEIIGTSFKNTTDLTDGIGCATFKNESDLTSKIRGTSYNQADPTSDMLVLNHNCKEKSATDLFKELFPFGTICETDITKNGQISIEAIEKSKRILLQGLKANLTKEEIKKKNCFSMVDVDIDSPNYVNEKVANVGFDDTETYINKLKNTPLREDTEKKEPYVDGVKEESGKKKAEFDFDYQPKLEGHPGPSPSVILQALTMSNANDGINLERLETIGDSFLKFAITAYLYCAQPTVHEGKLSHMRSKQVSNLNLYRLGRGRRLGARMIASKFEPHDNWLPPCHRAPATMPGPRGHTALQEAAYWQDTQSQEEHEPGCSAPRADSPPGECGCGRRERDGCFIPYNLITQHSIPDKSVADCVEALIGAYLIECGPRGALLFMSWLGIKVLPRYEVPLDDRPELEEMEKRMKEQRASEPPPRPGSGLSSSSSSSSLAEGAEGAPADAGEDTSEPRDWGWETRRVGTLRPYRDRAGRWLQPVFGELKAPPSPLLRYIENPDGELEQMLSGYEALERTLGYRFRDRSLLLQALTHASHHLNRLTDCYQRLEFLGDAILDYLITRHLYEDERRHSPGALTDLRSALVNNTIFATLAVRHGFHKYFRHMSPGLNEVLTRYVKIQEENGHSISEEHYLIQEDEMEQAEDVEVPKALGDLFESVAGAIFLDSGMSLGAVWRSYVGLMGAELEAFSAAAPKSPVRELLEAEPDTAKFGKPERLADGRRVRVCVEVFGRGTFKGVGRNYRIAKGTAARCALRHLKRAYRNDTTV